MMAGKEQQETFNPEFGYLENSEILELQLLFDQIVMAENREARGDKPVIFREQWCRLLEKYAAEAKTDDSHLRQLIRFFRRNLSFLDKGGMLLGRSEIGIIMSEENKKLMSQYGSLAEELERDLD